MDSRRPQCLALALLASCGIAAIVLAGIAAMDLTASPRVAVAALALSAALFAGVAVLHRALREARWDAGER
jgi:hypothetical protein